MAGKIAQADRKSQTKILRSPGSISKQVIYGQKFRIERLNFPGPLLSVHIQGAVVENSDIHILLDLSLISKQPEIFTNYLGKMKVEPDDDSLDELLPKSREAVFANFQQLSYFSETAEMIFGQISYHELSDVNIPKDATGARNIYYAPILTVMSTLGFHKKLQSEILSHI